MSSENETERWVVYGLIVVGMLTLLYSVLIASRPLAWFTISIPLVLVYLFWRLVRAIERIATAQEDSSSVSDEQS